MFDIGFSELFLVAIVALVVLGPERLPKAARFAGLWINRARAQWNSVKSEFENQVADEELAGSLRATRDEMADMQRQFEEGGESLRRDFEPDRDQADFEEDRRLGSASDPALDPDYDPPDFDPEYGPERKAPEPDEPDLEEPGRREPQPGQPERREPPGTPEPTRRDPPPGKPGDPPPDKQLDESMSERADPAAGPPRP